MGPGPQDYKVSTKLTGGTAKVATIGNERRGSMDKSTKPSPSTYTPQPDAVLKKRPSYTISKSAVSLCSQALKTEQENLPGPTTYSRKFVNLKRAPSANFLTS